MRLDREREDLCSRQDEEVVTFEEAQHRPMPLSMDLGRRRYVERRERPAALDFPNRLGFEQRALGGIAVERHESRPRTPRAQRDEGLPESVEGKVRYGGLDDAAERFECPKGLLANCEDARFVGDRAAEIAEP